MFQIVHTPVVVKVPEVIDELEVLVRELT